MSSKSESAKILVAEDEVDVLDLLTMNLKAAGYKVLQAEDGNSALKQVRNVVPSLVLLH